MFNILLHSRLAFISTARHTKSHEEQLYSWQSKDSV